jgi:NTE family protein
VRREAILDAPEFIARPRRQESRAYRSRHDALAISLGGGGARAAYQAGVLRGLAKHFPDLRPTILTGESAGAINVAYLAAHRGSLPDVVEDLTALWSQLTADHVFRIDVPWLARNIARWATRLVSGGAAIAPQVRGLLEMSPLRSLLERALEPADGRIVGIADNLRKGLMKAIALTTINYSTGQSVTWVEGRGIPDWERPLRRSVRTQLTVDHVLASAALPFIFPAVRLDDGWHGDGGIRLHAPFSPAIHLGARRILAISTRPRQAPNEANGPAVRHYPAPADVAGILLDAIFLDLIDDDALALQRVNSLLERLPPEDWGELRPVDLLVIHPSQDLSALAADCEPGLPRAFRFLTRGLGTRETSRPAFLSLLMFVPEYLQRLIRIGEADVEPRLEEIAAFLAT